MSKKNELAFIDTAVPEVLSVLDKKIAELKHIEDTVYKTTGTLDGFGDIKSEMKIENLVRAFSMICGKEEAYGKAQKRLGVQSAPAFTINGGNTEQWEHDIKLRIAIITHKETLDTLNGFKAEMSKFLSAEDQKAMVMQKMMDFLKK